MSGLLFELDQGPFGLLSQHRRQVGLRRGDGHQVVVLVEQLQHRGRQKRGQRGSDADVAHAHPEQREQNGHRLLLVPAQHQREGQIVDAALKGRGQGLGNF